MSGHSHWARIKHDKASNDNKRGAVWSKLARRIIVAAKVGGGNPDENLSLRYAIDDSKAANMPSDTIRKAILKGTGELNATTYEDVMYEAYGPGGVAYMVEGLTDNRSRTAPEMRKIFERFGGQLGASNCVAWMFEKKGVFAIDRKAAEEDALMEIALAAGADDVTTDEKLFEVTCHPTQFAVVKQALADKGIATISGEIAMIPKTTVQVTGDKARSVLKLMEMLEDHDDVQHVYANFEMSDEVMAEAEKD
jgi:YebC/PmpR family DNA-binding regulatory protein